LLNKNLEFNSLKVVKKIVSKDKSTTKVIFKKNKDGKLIETVLMNHNDGRNTVCVSCMVGCPVNCDFCATGKMGFNGNLTSQEIVDQIMYFARELKGINEKISNIVYMGMGEPMLNFINVIESIKVLTDPNKLALSKRRITISTSGYVSQLRTLVEKGFRGRLAISLHASNQILRETLMPVVAKSYPLDNLMRFLDEYVELTNKRISYEYILIDGINDTDINAIELSKLLKNRLAHVNLIPFNTISGSNFKRSSKNRMQKFAEILDKNGINYSLRVTMGEDINAACGQLTTEILEEDAETSSA